VSKRESVILVLRQLPRDRVIGRSAHQRCAERGKSTLIAA
jgi:hypothetical protein